MGIVTIAIITVILVFLPSADCGQAFITAGDNPVTTKSFGIHTGTMIIIGLVVPNRIAGLCGALIAQNNGYAGINMRIGTIVIAPASIIVGEVALGKLTLNQRFVVVTLSSIICRVTLFVVL